MADTAVDVERSEVLVRTRWADTIPDEILRVEREILEKAYELFEERGHQEGHHLDDWFAAERQIIWRPAIELSERNGVYRIRAAVPGIDPSEIDVQLTEEDVLIQADVQHEHTDADGTVHECEFMPGKLFRSIHLPSPVDPWRAESVVMNGILELTVPLAAGGKRERTIDIAELVPDAGGTDIS